MILLRTKSGWLKFKEICLIVQLICIYSDTSCVHSSKLNFRVDTLHFFQQSGTTTKGFWGDRLQKPFYFHKSKIYNTRQTWRLLDRMFYEIRIIVILKRMISNIICFQQFCGWWLATCFKWLPCTKYHKSKKFFQYVESILGGFSERLIPKRVHQS